MKHICLILLSVSLLLSFSACNSESITNDNQSNTSDVDENSAQDSSNSDNSASVNVDFGSTDEDMFTDRDNKSEYNESECIKITLQGDTATADDDSVEIKGGTVTITKDAPHIISGTLNDGMIIVNAPDTAKLQIVLNNANITSTTSAALYVLEADKVFVTLASGTSNSLANGGSFIAIDENNIDSALFSKQDITFNGTGNLTVTSPAGHGIVAKDDLAITGGNFTVDSASHGVDANDSVRITGNTNININAGKDGIHCENDDDVALGYVYISNGKINIESQGDGISAGAYAQISNGEITILAGGGYENGNNASSDNYGDFMPGGGRPGGGMHGGPMPYSVTETAAETDSTATSMKGIKAESGILISNGIFNIDSADDAVHSNKSLVINGGNIQIASGDDAVHAEEKLDITAGVINITNSYEGLEALNITVSGGDIKLVATDDGLNAAGGMDSSGTAGGRDGMYGGGRPGDPGGGMSANSNGSIIISGGNLYINSSGDGIDANGTLAISGGYTVVVGPTVGDTATLDFDKSATISGGTFIGTGASNMAQTFSSSSQGVIALRVGNQPENTQITVKDTAGNTLVEHSPELSFQVLIFSCSEMKSGETYSVTIGSYTEEVSAS